MAKVDVGQSVTILANLGVIAGIVFLGIELRQNNELMEAEARFNRLSLSREAYNIQSTNGELAEILVKANNGDELTEVEHYRYRMAGMRFLSNMEWIFNELPVTSSERQYLQEQLRLNLATEASLYRPVFIERRASFSDEFVRWVEDEIFDEP